MTNYREILRMASDSSYSIRQIKADAHCSYDTIRATIDAAKAKGISWPLDDDVSNEELQGFPVPGKVYVAPDLRDAGLSADS